MLNKCQILVKFYNNIIYNQLIKKSRLICIRLMQTKTSIMLLIFNCSAIHIFLILQDLINQEINFIRHGIKYINIK